MNKHQTRPDRTRKPLALALETVRTLRPEQLAVVAGGITPTNSSCHPFCP